MFINPIDYYSNINFGSVYSDYQAAMNCFAPVAPFEMNTNRRNAQLNDFIILPDEQTAICFENTKQVLEKYEQQEKYKVQPKDFLYKNIPIWSRFDTAKKLVDQGDYGSAFTMATLAIMFGPEDLREVYSATKQIKSLLKRDNSFILDYDYKIAQHPGSFFRGSLLHDFMNPFAPNARFPKLKKWLLEQDKAWVDTKIGEKVRNYLGINIDYINTKIPEVVQIEGTVNTAPAYQFIGKSSFGKLTARALTRTPVLGTVADAGLEVLQAKHDIKQGENPMVALFKAGCRFVTLTILTAFGGAIGSFFGPVGTIAGVTVANYASNKIANAIS